MLAGNAGVGDRDCDPLGAVPALDVPFPVVGAVWPLVSCPGVTIAVVPPDTVASLGVQASGNLSRHEPFGDDATDLLGSVRLVNVVQDHSPERLLVPVQRGTLNGDHSEDAPDRAHVLFPHGIGVALIRVLKPEIYARAGNDLPFTGLA